MEIFSSYYTDKGIVKQINQDSFSVKVVNSPKGKIALAILCDGMGGLEHGELASKEVVMAFNDWFAKDFAQMVTENSFGFQKLTEEWQYMIDLLNNKLDNFAKSQGVKMGTTLSVLLLYMDQYYFGQVGDSRIYKIDNCLKQLTSDQTLVAQEVRLGMLTEEEAKVDPRRSILLQCVGASRIIKPQYEMGKLEGECTFLLCSDGFVHELSEEEILTAFTPANIPDRESGNRICEEMVHRVMDRNERDNVTAVAVVVRL